MSSHLLDLDRERLREFLDSQNAPAFRLEQLWRWLHRDRADDVDAMTNLPKPLRDALREIGSPRQLEERRHQAADDGLTEKWLWDAEGARFESVLIRERGGTRRTACVSSMAGCPLGCRFCATGRGGFVRNLSAGEIVEQAYRVDRAARRGEDGAPGVDHVVFMGMGEPLLNYDAAVGAARILADPGGMGLSARRVTLSTVGVPEGLRRLAAEAVPFRLAWSLHAASQELRESLIPAAKRWPLSEVMPALRAFAADAGRGVTVEYCLIRGVNDSDGDARSVAELLAGVRCKANLLPLNPVEGFHGRPPGAERVRRFRDALEAGGVPATIRVEKGGDISAACGQLAGDDA